MLAEHVTLRHADLVEVRTQMPVLPRLLACLQRRGSLFSFRGTLPVLGTFGGGMIVRNAGAPAFFCSPKSMLCRAAPKLIRSFSFSFFVLQVPISRFRTLLLAPLTDGLPRSTCLPLRPVDLSPSPPSLLYLLPNSLRH